MKASVLGTAKPDDQGGISVAMAIGEPPNVRIVDVPLSEADVPSGGLQAILSSPEPRKVPTFSGPGRHCYLFRGKLIR